MGIQIHSAPQAQARREAHPGRRDRQGEGSARWSGKPWGDTSAAARQDGPDSQGLRLGLWLGVAAERPFIGDGYYHPGNWRKRLDFGTGTFGDMGCHILDPVFGAVGVTNLTSIRSELPGPNEYNWPLDVQVKFVFPGTRFTTDPVTLHWYNGNARPPEAVRQAVNRRLTPKGARFDPKTDLDFQGSIFIGTVGVLYSQYDSGSIPLLYPAEQYKEFKLPEIKGDDHYLQFVEAVRGNGQTSAPFSYSGPLSEMVLLGCLATRFPKTDLKWDAKALKVTNHDEANKFVRRSPRKGWEVEGL